MNNIKVFERRGYKKTKLGWIPGEWGMEMLKEISEIQSGGTPLKDNRDYWGGTIPWYSAKDLKKFYLESSINKVTEEGAKNGTRIIKAGTILVLVRGMMLNRDFPVGITTRTSTFNQDLKAITANAETDSTFLAYSLVNQKNRILGLVNRSSHGTGKLETSSLTSYRFPLPPLPEQQKIAKILSTWDKGIEKLKGLIEAKEAQKKGLMQRLFLPRKDWKEYSYREIIKEVKRPFDWDDEEKYHLISVKRRSGGLFFRESLYGHQIKTKNLRTAHKGDFLISKMQIVHGASGLTTEDFHGMKISGSYIAVISKNQEILLVEYLNWLSKMPRFYHQTYISSYGVHIEKMTFNFKLFLKSTVQLPDIATQSKTIEILNKSDEELIILRHKLAALETQKKGMMQQLLTGKTRVKLVH